MSQPRERAHRKPPLLAPVDGVCRWCGLPCERWDEKPLGPGRFLNFHKDCYDLCCKATNARRFYPELVARDGEICNECGKVQWRWLPKSGYRWAPSTKVLVEEVVDGKLHRTEIIEVVFRAVLEVDHVVALWRVTDLPAEKRRAYFLLENLQLLCDECHGRKSAKDCAEAAHFERLSKRRSVRVRAPFLGLDGQRLV